MGELADNSFIRTSLGDPEDRVADIPYEVIATYPHHPSAFTEGLCFLDGALYESTGPTKTAQSTLRRVEVHTGRILKLCELPAKYFAEGITIFQQQIIQLTELSGKAFVYDVNTFARLETLTYKGRGWGLTHDGQNLIMGDGSNQLFLVDARTFRRVGKPLNIFFNGKPLVRLNELEYVKGWLYANVWMTDFIYRINPQTGAVLGRVDLCALRPQETKDCEECVLNGIAWDPRSDHLFVTGKMWPTMFEIRLLP